MTLKCFRTDRKDIKLYLLATGIAGAGLLGAKFLGDYEAIKDIPAYLLNGPTVSQFPLSDFSDAFFVEVIPKATAYAATLCGGLASVLGWGISVKDGIENLIDKIRDSKEPVRLS